MPRAFLERFMKRQSKCLGYGSSVVVVSQTMHRVFARFVTPIASKNGFIECLLSLNAAASVKWSNWGSALRCVRLTSPKQRTSRDHAQSRQHKLPWLGTFSIVSIAAHLHTDSDSARLEVHHCSELPLRAYPFAQIRPETPPKGADADSLLEVVRRGWRREYFFVRGRDLVRGISFSMAGTKVEAKTKDEEERRKTRRRSNLTIRRNLLARRANSAAACDCLPGLPDLAP